MTFPLDSPEPFNRHNGKNYVDFTRGEFIGRGLKRISVALGIADFKTDIFPWLVA